MWSSLQKARIDVCGSFMNDNIFTIPAYDFKVYFHHHVDGPKKGPTHHAYAWQIGSFWQDTLHVLLH